MNLESEPRRSLEPAQWASPGAPWGQDHFSRANLWRAQVHRYATAFRKRWRALLLTFLLISGSAVYYAAAKRPAFRSEAILWMGAKLSLPNAGFHDEDLARYIATQSQLIKTVTIQSRAFEKVRARFPALPETPQNTPSVHLPFDLTARILPRGLVVQLQAVGPTPEATQAFLDAIIDEYLAFKNDSRKRSSSGALSGITAQLNEVQTQIQQQESQLTLFQMSNNLSYLTEHGLSAGSHLSKLDETLSDLRTEDRLLDMLNPAQFKSLAEGPQFTLLDAVVPGERAARPWAIETTSPQSAYYQALQQAEILKAKRDEFARVLRPTHSTMVKLNQEIAGLEQLLKTLQADGEQRALTQMVNRKKALELQIQNLNTQYHDWEINASEASQKLAEYDRLKEDLQRSQGLYDRLLGLLQTVDLNNGLEQELLLPMAPASHARPTVARAGIMAAGLILALMGAVIVLLALEFFDDRFNSVQELSLQIRAEVVGQVPKIGLVPPNGDAGLIPGALQSAFAESFRNLRSFLLFLSNGCSSQCKVILITSAVLQEGKTTVASNLACALAKSGSRVLLVDADTRSGSLHHIFRVGPKPGLLDVLSQRVLPAQAIVPTTHPDLFLLPAGESNDKNSDVFLQGQMDQLLHALAAQYSYIIIDSAPVLATDDTTCLAPETNGVFMVVRASYTPARATREALDRLHKRKVNVLGIVYNCAPPASDYYCRYSRDYHTLKKGVVTSVSRTS